MKVFFKTVFFVTAFSVSEKCLGFLYRIFLSRSIGSEGVGLYQVALSVFAILFTICSSGVPITVSRLITKYKAENRPDKERQVISAGILLSFVLAIICVAVFFVFPNSFDFLFADIRCKKIFYVILMALPFTSIYSVYRGVFWGNKDFLPYSIIELLEELCMICVGIVLIIFSADVMQGSFYAGVAVAVSYVFSFSLACILFFVRKNKLLSPWKELRPLILSSYPITAMRLASTFAVSLVSIILPIRLIASGLTEAQAMSAFGSAVGEAIPLLFIPSTLIGSFTLVLIPEIADNFYRGYNKNLKIDIEKSIKFTTVVSCVFVPVYTVLGSDIGIIVFNSTDCGKYISVSAFLMVFIGLSNLTTSILNSIGQEKKTLLYYAIGGVFMMLSIWFLPMVVGIYGLLIGFAFVYAITSVLNLMLINKKCKEKPKYVKFCVLCVLLIIPVCLLGIVIKNLLLPLIGTFLTLITVGAFILLTTTLLYRVFDLIDFSLVINEIKLKINKNKAM